MATYISWLLSNFYWPNGHHKRSVLKNLIEEKPALDFALSYTLGAIALYFITGWILDYIERWRGKRFAQRNIIFFALIFILAFILMNLINPVPENLPDEPNKELSTPAN